MKRPMPSQAAFEAYEKVRRRGRWNMYDQRAQKATKLDTGTYRAVIEHYSELRKAYPDVRKDA